MIETVDNKRRYGRAFNGTHVGEQAYLSIRRGQRSAARARSSAQIVATFGAVSPASSRAMVVWDSPAWSATDRWLRSPTASRSRALKRSVNSSSANGGFRALTLAPHYRVRQAREWCMNVPPAEVEGVMPL
jgi:hypothetical protein